MEIDQDFGDLGHDALDWVRGRRPWFQFLNYCEGLAKTPGTRLRAAQLNDDRYLADIEQMLENMPKSDEPYRPPLEHFDTTVEAIYALSDDVRQLTEAIVRQPIKRRLRPEQPQDRIKKRKRDFGRARLAQLLRGE